MKGNSRARCGLIFLITLCWFFCAFTSALAKPQDTLQLKFIQKIKGMDELNNSFTSMGGNGVRFSTKELNQNIYKRSLPQSASNDYRRDGCRAIPRLDLPKSHSIIIDLKVNPASFYPMAAGNPNPNIQSFVNNRWIPSLIGGDAFGFAKQSRASP